MNRYQQLIDEIRECRVLSEIVEEQGVTAEQRLAEMRDRLERAEHMALTILRTDGARHES